MAGHPEGGDLVVLSVRRVLAAVEARSVGRFAANRPGMGPLVVPVNYVIDGDHRIVFRTGPGAKLNAVGHGVTVIQIDDVDPLHQTGWSVMIEGTTSWLYEEQDQTAVESWAPGPRTYVVRMTPVRVSGRRIHLPQADTDQRGYR